LFANFLPSTLIGFLGETIPVIINRGNSGAPASHHGLELFPYQYGFNGAHHLQFSGPRSTIVSRTSEQKTFYQDKTIRWESLMKISAVKMGVFKPGIALAAALVVTGVPAVQAAEVTLKLVSMLPKKTAIGETFGGFIDRLNAKMKGELKIDWRGGPEVIPQFKQPNAVRLGSIDATLTSPSYVNGIVNVSGSANYSNKDFKAIKESGYYDYMTELHKAKGLVYIGELPVTNQPFHIFLAKPIAKLSDLKNMKIRVFPAIAPAIKALGALPVVLPMPAIYTSMERGLVQGYVTGAAGVARQYKGVTGAYVERGFYRATFHFLMNPRAWAKVPAATQAKLLDFVRSEDPAAYEASWQPILDASYKGLTAANIKAVKFSAEETKQLDKIVYESAWAEVKKKAPVEGAKIEGMLYSK
jgi:TRAP-type transport system periplasmic protein